MNPLSHRSPRRARGFTLLEALVAAAIVAILASLAYPSYADYVSRARIVEGIWKLADFRVRMEQYFMDHRSFRNVDGCGVADEPARAKDHFNVTCEAPSATTYTITAQGVGSMSAFTYAVDQANAKSSVSLPPGWTYTDGCWVTRKNGDC